MLQLGDMVRLSTLKSVDIELYKEHIGIITEVKTDNDPRYTVWWVNSDLMYTGYGIEELYKLSED